jgi:hypothetical protein
VLENLKLTRREALIAGGAGGLSMASFDLALGQGGRRRGGVEPQAAKLQPKKLGPNVELARRAANRASQFQLAGKPLRLKPDTSGQFGLVQRFELPKTLQTKLKRRESVVEVVATRITDGPSVARVRSRLLEVGSEDVDRQTLGRAALFHVASARRAVDLRDRRQARAALSLTAKIPRAQQVDMLLALAPSARHGQARLKVVFTTPAWARIFITPLPPIPPIGLPTPPSPGPPADFGTCFWDCFVEVPPWTLVAAVTVCGGCSSLIPTLRAGEIDRQVVGAVCTSCAAAVGAVAGLCLLGCVEQHLQS